MPVLVPCECQICGKMLRTGFFLLESPRYLCCECYGWTMFEVMRLKRRHERREAKAWARSLTGK